MKSVELFHARGDVERGPLIRSYNWKDLVEVRPGRVRLLVLSPNTRLIRSTSQLLLALVPAVVLLVPWRIMYFAVASALPSWTFFLWLSSSIIIFFGLWTPLMFGGFYLFDYLTIPLQARSAKPVASLTVMDVRLGRFRHTLRTTVEPLISVKTEGRELVLTVFSTRKRLDLALRPQWK